MKQKTKDDLKDFMKSKGGWVAAAALVIFLVVSCGIKGCSENCDNQESNTYILNFIAELEKENRALRDSTLAYQDAQKRLQDSLANVSSRLDSCEAGKRCLVKPKPVKKPVKKPTPVKPAPVKPAPVKPDTIVVTHVDDKDTTKIVCPKNGGAVNVDVRDNASGNTVNVNTGVVINNNNYDKDAVEVTKVVKRRIIVTYDRCR